MPLWPIRTRSPWLTGFHSYQIKHCAKNVIRSYSPWEESHMLSHWVWFSRWFNGYFKKRPTWQVHNQSRFAENMSLWLTFRDKLLSDDLINGLLWRPIRAGGDDALIAGTPLPAIGRGGSRCRGSSRGLLGHHPHTDLDDIAVYK